MSLSLRVDSNKYIAPMRQALEECDISKIIYLIQEGANINSLDENGWGFLHVAAKIGDVKIIKLLVESGANIKLLNKPFTLLDEQIYAGIEYNPSCSYFSKSSIASLLLYSFAMSNAV